MSDRSVALPFERSNRHVRVSTSVRDRWLPVPPVSQSDRPCGPATSDPPSEAGWRGTVVSADRSMSGGSDGSPSVVRRNGNERMRDPGSRPYPKGSPSGEHPGQTGGKIRDKKEHRFVCRGGWWEHAPSISSDPRRYTRDLFRKVAVPGRTSSASRTRARSSPLLTRSSFALQALCRRGKRPSSSDLQQLQLQNCLHETAHTRKLQLVEPRTRRSVSRKTQIKPLGSRIRPGSHPDPRQRNAASAPEIEKTSEPDIA